MLNRFTSGFVVFVFLFLNHPLDSAVRNSAIQNRRPNLSSVEEDPFERIPNVRFFTRATDHTTYFIPNGLILTGFTASEQVAEPPQYFELKLFMQKVSGDVEVTTLNPRLARSDFEGSDSPSWLTHIPDYAKVKYTNLYPNVDMLFQVQQRQLDLWFVIAPGGDPKDIRFQVHGAHDLRITQEGALLLDVQNVTFELPKPIGYQARDESSARHVVDARYVIAGKNEVGLQVSSYDAKRILVIHR